MAHTIESGDHFACQKRMTEEGGKSRCCVCIPHDDCSQNVQVLDESSPTGELF